MKIPSKSYTSVIALAVCAILVSSCNKPASEHTQIQPSEDISIDKSVGLSFIGENKNRLNIYHPVTLSADITHLSIEQNFLN